MQVELKKKKSVQKKDKEACFWVGKKKRSSIRNQNFG